MSSKLRSAGHTLAKPLGIKLGYRSEIGQAQVTRGESILSEASAELYVEEEPTSWEWICETIPSPKAFWQYLAELFPFLPWISHYNGQWLFGDVVAGITVGVVVIPQSMAYAILAQLPPEFGLYSAFMGVLVYWFFATSKDTTVGPVAVVSTMVGTIILKAKAKGSHRRPEDIASAVAVLSGGIILAIGLLRCGWIVEFISLSAITAFMTGSAINIAVGQVPTMMGITGFSTRDSTYKVAINIIKHLGRTKIDAAMGLSALFLLYLCRYLCSLGAKCQPHRRKLYFILGTMRTAFVILLYTFISFLVNQDRRKKPLFKILRDVPRGFKYAGVPPMDGDLIKLFISELPATVIVLLIEHIAISKSFGRINNYTINPSQELVAIGVTNILGPFLGAYPATGSFTRTAIKSKAGVRTPFSGFITAIVVLLALYALPAVFFYIPSASLSAVIIHAVGDLVTPPNVVYQFWLVSPLEVFIFFAGVFVTIFTNIENGIYTTVAASAAMLLFRVVKARGWFLGRIKVQSVVGNTDTSSNSEGDGKAKGFALAEIESSRDVFLPMDHRDGSNPQVEMTFPYPGIFIYRFSEGFNYPNANHYLDYLTEIVQKHTRRTNPQSLEKLGDRPWNNPGPRRGAPPEDLSLPTLKAVILDFSSVNNVDVTSIQILIDVRNQLDRWAAPEPVDWHFACITNRWTKRALIAAGFGYPSPVSDNIARWRPIFNITEIGGSQSAAAAAEQRENKRRKRAAAAATTTTTTTATTTEAENQQQQQQHAHDNDGGEAGLRSMSYGSGTLSCVTAENKGGSDFVLTTKTKVAVVHGINRPLFHIDLPSALRAAIHNVEERTQMV